MRLGGWHRMMGEMMRRSIGMPVSVTDPDFDRIYVERLLRHVRESSLDYALLLAQDEVYYLLAGLGRMHIEAETRVVLPGDAVHIPGGHVQWIENIGRETLRFVALVSPPWTAAGDELL